MFVGGLMTLGGPKLHSEAVGSQGLVAFWGLEMKLNNPLWLQNIRVRSGPHGDDSGVTPLN